MTRMRAPSDRSFIRLMARSTMSKEDSYQKYQMFVDNLLSAIPRHPKNTRQFIALNIELVYVILGYLGTITKPDLPPT